jgi:hypothetical protein
MGCKIARRRDFRWRGDYGGVFDFCILGIHIDLKNYEKEIPNKFMSNCVSLRKSKMSVPPTQMKDDGEESTDKESDASTS